MEKDVNYEKILNEELGFEDDIDGLEKNDDELSESDYEDYEKPFNAESIRIEQQMLSLKYVYELYQDGVLQLTPGFQRQYVWRKLKKKSMLIESLMLRIPIPAFYFFEKNDGSFIVIDGQQRLKTIFDFLEGKFSLFGLEYLGNTHNKKKFNDLELKYQQRIKRTQLAINILTENSPQKVVYDIFRRINSGGMPLNPQEMRNAICSNTVRQFLKEGANCNTFNEAIRNKINDLRLDKQEIFLRFSTIYCRYDFSTQELQKLSPSKLTPLMDNEIIEIDHFSETKRNEILRAFERSMKKCTELFGNYAFLNISLDNDNNIKYKKDIINKPLLIAFSVLLSNPKLITKELSVYKKEACEILASHLKDNSYQNSISKATGDERNIKICLQNSLEVLKECGITDL